MRQGSIVLAALVAGCVVHIPARSAVQQNGDTLRARASFDFRCPKDQIVVTEIDDQTAGVDGCGQRGTYIFLAHMGSWVLNSPGTEQVPQEPPPPPAQQPLLPQPPVWQQQQQQQPISPAPHVPGTPPGHG